MCVMKNQGLRAEIYTRYKDPNIRIVLSLVLQAGCVCVCVRVVGDWIGEGGLAVGGF